MRRPTRTSVSVWVKRTRPADRTGGPGGEQRFRTVLARLLLAVTVTTVLAVAFVLGSAIAIIIGIFFIAAVAAALVVAAFKRSKRLRP